jgi:hypothetical protein
VAAGDDVANNEPASCVAFPEAAGCTVSELLVRRERSMLTV